MKGFGSNEMETVVDPELAVGHLVFKVADLKRRGQFYSNLGLPPFAIDEEVAIIELRGGTYPVIGPVSMPRAGSLPTSGLVVPYPQRPKRSCRQACLWFPKIPNAQPFGTRRTGTILVASTVGQIVK